jgi:hypothetical protein
MTQPRRLPTKVSLPPALPRQMSIVFDSIRLLGLTAPERMKALTHLTHLLMLAAGVMGKENDDER